MHASTSRRSGLVLIAVFLTACGRSGAPENAAEQAAAGFDGPPPEAVAIAAFDGPLVLGVPRYPDATAAIELQTAMRKAWLAEGEPESLFEVRLGEEILATEAPFDLVREFYLPYVHKVFMDHEMEFPGVGTQRMFTGLVINADGEIVKFTITRPFFRYPDQAAVDRTVLQFGRVGGTS